MIDNYECKGQMTLADLFAHDTQFMKMSPEHSVQTKGKTSEPSLKKPSKSQTKMPLFLDLRGNGHRADVSWERDLTDLIPLLGEFMMPNFGECHRGERDYVFSPTTTDSPPQRYYLNMGEKPMNPIITKLSDILEEDADPKYFLSSRACQGILNRAEKRGKQLPEILKTALENQL